MRTISLMVLAIGLAWPGWSHAGFDDCRLNGRVYPQGAYVCQRGLRQHCVNGSWQNLDGARCGKNGQYLNPGQYYIVQDPVIIVEEEDVLSR